MTDNYRILIASPPDREKVVAEVWCGEEMLAEVANEDGPLTIEFYPKPGGKPWLLDYEEAVKAMQMAKDKLLGES
jgi:hypothetical protein